MTQIIFEENDRLEWALKTFRGKVQRCGILRELRNRGIHTTPCIEAGLADRVYKMSDIVFSLT